jgi:hypothetical protein
MEGSGMRSSTSGKILAAAAATAASFSLLASPSAASQPEPASCIGESFSTGAGPGFGQGVVFFAQVGGPLSTHPGLGDGIQLLQAGLVPDQVLPNLCN